MCSLVRTFDIILHFYTNDALVIAMKGRPLLGATENGHQVKVWQNKSWMSCSLSLDIDFNSFYRESKTKFNYNGFHSIFPQPNSSLKFVDAC